MKKAEIKINGEWLPQPDDDLRISAERIQTEHETAAGTTVINVVRQTKLSISGTWTVSGIWAYMFRMWRQADTVTASVCYPNPGALSEYTCQFIIKEETHVRNAKEQIPGSGGIYKMSVEIKEL